MSKSRRRKPPAITAQKHRNRRTCSIQSAARLKNTETANPETLAALSLLNAAAVRERAHRMLAIGLEDRLPNFRVHLAKMDGVIDLVLQITRNTYPSLEVPFHARWRHFVANDADRWAEIAGRARWVDTASRARAEFDLPWSASFSTPALDPSGAIAIPKA